MRDRGEEAPAAHPHWTRVEEIFLAASELAPEERAAYLAAACGGDTTLAAEVESLLRYDRAPTGPEAGGGEATLSAALWAGAASVLDEGAAPGTRFGPYEIERELGRGGMAVVYLARRADGAFEKEVALKLIQGGLDSATVVARMRQERRILAELDHPGIAHLYDGGTTAQGAPWLAMERVEGRPIDRYCAETKASVRQRCELLARICDAVAYAHRKLVVHRDLKPANILVDDEGQPKLLDFGIAKLLASEPGVEAAQLTGEWLRPYTPGYASPEQVSGGWIGTASDVYSLGVVGFELLAGARPGAGLAAAAEGAGRSRSWARELRGDLEAILAKALRPEPERRYATVDQMGDDLRRYLAGKPVSARRGSRRYRLGKLLRRHRWAAAAALVLTLGAGAAAGLYVHQARLARQRFDDLRQFANSFLFDVDAQLQSMPDASAARAVIVQKAIGYLSSLALENRNDRQLQLETGRAWRRVASVQDNPQASSLGDAAGARASLARSIAILEPLAASERGPRQNGDARAELVASYLDAARLERSAGNLAAAGGFLNRAAVLARPSGNDRGLPAEWAGVEQERTALAARPRPQP